MPHNLLCSAEGAACSLCIQQLLKGIKLPETISTDKMCLLYLVSVRKGSADAPIRPCLALLRDLQSFTECIHSYGGYCYICFVLTTVWLLLSHFVPETCCLLVSILVLAENLLSLSSFVKNDFAPRSTATEM